MPTGNHDSCIHHPKQWIALKARSDWLLKLRISFAIYLRATRFASVTSEEITQINFCGVNYLTVLVYY